jgi:hypothetical protein
MQGDNDTVTVGNIAHWQWHAKELRNQKSSWPEALSNQQRFQYSMR